MFTAALYLAAAILLLISFHKDKAKTLAALRKGWKAFEHILPQFLVIIIIIGITLSMLTPEIISGLLGERSGWLGMAIASVTGSISLIPGFVAFPLAAALLQKGAGLMVITLFVSTLMAVGVVTLPLELKYFGKKVAFLRNGLSFAFAFVVAWAVVAVQSW